MKTTAILSTLVLTTAFAHAAQRSIVINKAPVRDFLTSRLNTSKTNLRLSTKLNQAKPQKGITPTAAEKARETLGGLQQFGDGTGGRNYVMQMGAKKLVVSTGRDSNWYGGDGKMKVVRFVARDGQSGRVVARGEIGGKQIIWTRSHNGEKPAERNAAK